MPSIEMLPTNLRDRLRIRFNRTPVTPIANWDSLAPVDLPQPDIDSAKAMILDRLNAHDRAGSLDDAYGDILDRLLRPLCRRWVQDTTRAYRKQLTTLDLLEDQGTEHHIRLGQQLARLDDDLARHQSQLAAAWRDCTREISHDGQVHDLTNRSRPPAGTKSQGSSPLPPAAVPRLTGLAATARRHDYNPPTDPHQSSGPSGSSHEEPEGPTDASIRTA